jgi:hypothetical protein
MYKDRRVLVLVTEFAKAQRRRTDVAGKQRNLAPRLRRCAVRLVTVVNKMAQKLDWQLIR